ncbi:SnoaL-like domain-containing protein [Haladaptatus litoreus]|uniref:SnoaL-like domain-containing protein n=1 Tax=Haladaptatus litoreus TaxID=553468 RepID=A0A1N7EFQ7_9EURY|nr:AtzH-like domain-containing protein [Haladaptatus litoreus]SIR86849.1 SnoaL-like domain-containing protein [Haladaptatus litoreus]
MCANNAETVINNYYEALRQGDELAVFFAPDDSLVKFGISEQLTGYEEVADGLGEQTRHSKEWKITSHDLQVTERDDHAWFSDTVDMAWTDTTTGIRRSFNSRWSGTLEDRDGWKIVGMHVSAPHTL